MHSRYPWIERVTFHLENEQQVIFSDSTDLTKIVRKERVGITKFTQWMETNKMCEEARELTYAEFPLKQVWKEKEKKWGKTKKGRSLGRIYYAHTTNGEKYYMRMLLNVIKGCTSFEEIRKVNGVVYKSYKAACEAVGFLDADKDCYTRRRVKHQIRQLETSYENFCTTILCDCKVTDPTKMWESCWEVLSEDMECKQIKILNYPTLRLTDSQKKDGSLLN